VVHSKYEDKASSVELYRLNEAGKFDTSWSSSRVTLTDALRSTAWSAALSQDRLLLFSRKYIADPVSVANSLYSFGAIADLRSMTNFPSTLRSDAALLMIGAKKTLAIVSARAITLFDPVSLERIPTVQSDISVGSGTSPDQFFYQSDGSLLLSGIFSAWYEGEEFRNHLRLKSDGLPDFSARLPAQLADRYCQAVGVTDRNELVLRSCGDEGSDVLVMPASGAAPRYIKLSSPTGSMSYFGPLAIDSGKRLYFVEARDNSALTVGRVALENGSRDIAWHIELKLQRVLRGDATVSRIQIDGKGGLWISLIGTQCFIACEDDELLWYSVAKPDLSPVSSGVLGGEGGPSIQLHLTKTHAYIGLKRFLLADGVVDIVREDSQWATRLQPLFVDDKYVYFDNRYVQPDQQAPAQISRASMLSRGEPDLTWQILIDRSVQPLSTLRLPTEQPPTFNFVGKRYSTANTTSSATAAYSDSQDADTLQTVIEYFSPVANRYFITGRVEEQTLLDGYPQLYSRTGMRFITISSKFRDGNAQPVCRFYSTPARGGSNTHFLGTGSDCAIVNAFKGYVYEGYDFGALRPEKGICPVSHPVAITRMFNNQGATAQGNHRYATNSSIIAQMSARGWVNEGAVFCAISATDPVN
jgi:hypothetical protein